MSKKAYCTLIEILEYHNMDFIFVVLDIISINNNNNTNTLVLVTLYTLYEVDTQVMSL